MTTVPLPFVRKRGAGFRKTRLPLGTGFQRDRKTIGCQLFRFDQLCRNQRIAQFNFTGKSDKTTGDG
jgi:hypothetical protein